MTEMPNAPRPALQALGSAVSNRLDRFGSALRIRGVAALAFGGIALIWPQKTLLLLVVLAGIYFLLDGLATLWAAIQSRELGAYLPQSLVGLALGAAVLLWPGKTAQMLLLLIGIWALLQGIGLVRSGLELKRETEEGTLLMGCGAILALFGVVALLWQGVGATAIAWIIALVAVVLGGLLLWLGGRLKQSAERLASGDRLRG